MTVVESAISAGVAGAETVPVSTGASKPLEIAKGVIDKLKTELVEVKSERESLSQQLADAKDQLAVTKTLVEELQDSLQTSDASASDAAALSDLQMQITAKTADCNKFAADLSAATAALAVSEAKTAELESEMARARSVIEDLETAKNATTENLSEIVEAMKQLEADKSSVTEEAAKRAAAETALERLERSAASLQGDYETVRATLARRERELETVKTGAEKAEAEAEQARRSEAAAKKASEEARLEAEKKVNAATWHQKEAEKKTSESRQALLKTEAEIASYKEEIAGLIAQQDSAMTQLTVAERNVFKLEISVAEETDKAKLLDKKLKTQEKKTKDATDRSEAASAQLAEALAKLKIFEEREKRALQGLLNAQETAQRNMYMVAGFVIVAMLAVFKTLGASLVC